MVKKLNAFTVAANPSCDAHNVYTPLVQRYRNLENEIAKKVTDNQNNSDF
jgi:hypothetical protein